MLVPHVFILQVLCDELGLSNDDKEKILQSAESELEKTMKMISDKCCMAWLVIATSSLLDEDGGEDVPQDRLETLAKNSGFRSAILQKVMRSSSSITSALAPDSLREYNSLTNIYKSISVGSCSTVTGTKPTWYLYQVSDDSQDVNYKVIAGCVNSYLEHNKSDQTVILCDWNISPRQVKPLLTGEVTLYDAGVEEFDYSSKPHHYTPDTPRQREDLVDWINKGGVLLTHDLMYRGCEAETILFISDRWDISIIQDSHWLSTSITALSLVKSFTVLLRQLSFAIKNQLVASKAPRGVFCLHLAGSLWHFSPFSAWKPPILMV